MKKGKRKISGSPRFGQHVRETRERLGITQLELARLVDSSPNHISAIETGKVTNPGIEIAHRIAKALRFQLSIGDQEESTDSPNPLVYQAPFSFDEPPKPEDEIEQELRSVSEAVLDRRLSSEERTRISRMLSSMAQWLRDRALEER